MDMEGKKHTRFGHEHYLRDKSETVDEKSWLKKNRRLKILLFVFFISIFAGGSSLGYYQYFQNKKSKETAEKRVAPKNIVLEEKKVEEKPKPEVTWIEPIESADLGVFNKVVIEHYEYQNKTYKVATTRDGGEIYVVKSNFGPSIIYYRFKKSADGKISFLKLQSAEQEEPGLFNANVIIDPNTKYEDLEVPEKITLPNGAVLKKLYTDDFISNIKNTTKVSDTTNGSLYVGTSQNDKMTALSGRNFYLRLADTTTFSYSLEIEYYNKETQAVSITMGGIKVDDKYDNYMVSHCGRKDSTILKNPNVDAKGLVVIGSTTAKEDIYGFGDINSLPATEIYNLYKEMNDGKILSTTDTALQNLTKEQFYALSPKPVFLAKDPLGQYIVYIRTGLKSVGGCGKPVIYLYPEHEMPVGVKVGANVTVSIPEYMNGWNVVASPNGAIKYQGKTWDYLFWEGQGYGAYPEATEGTIVSQFELKNTLEQQLTLLGLNKKEKSDFVDFWMIKLPKTPYVRLSWLRTRDMERLAPLKINPKPDTLIRVFLDYEGLDKSYDLPAQKLTAVPRKGFTVVEWGGLKTW